MRVTHFAREVAMGPDEVLSLVPPATLQRLKRTEERPEIRVYAVAHEGEARGRMVGRGGVVIRYLRDTVRRLAEKLTPGTAVFHRHGATNDHAGRERIGEVVGKGLKELGGKLYAVAAVHLAPKHRNPSLDVASIETELEVEERDGNVLEACNVEGITGIALASSTEAAPGFPGARLLGAAAFFRGTEEMDYTNPDDNDFIPGSGQEHEDLEEWLGAVRANDFIPW